MSLVAPPLRFNIAMVAHLPFRTALRTATLAVAVAACAAGGILQGARALAEQPNGPPVYPSAVRPPASRPARPQQEHLAQWMDRHSHLSLEQQQNALEHEPGFRDLPQQTQQRMRDRLTQLNNMPPEQRRRLLERTEAMERLSPPERQEIRGAMQQLGALPVDRRRLVARAFRELREMPVPQRQSVLGSDRFRAEFSDQERNTLGNLLTVEPYLPGQRFGSPGVPGETPER